ncbi:MAG: hypothetical protein ABH829_02045 [archaeon]
MMFEASVQYGNETAYAMVLYHGRELWKKIHNEKLLGDFPDPHLVAYAAIFVFKGLKKASSEMNFFAFDEHCGLLERIREAKPPRKGPSSAELIENALRGYEAGNAEKMAYDAAKKITHFIVDELKLEGAEVVKEALFDNLLDKGYIRKGFLL